MMNESDIGGMAPYTGAWLCAPPFWKAYAEQLKDAASLLFQRMKQDIEDMKGGKEVDPVFVMGPAVFLASLAIENLLKGIIVIDHPEYVDQGRLQGKVIKLHNLIRLASEARVTLADQEKTL